MNLKVQENASANLLESNHQLESRIQEIWQSGSEGGAKATLSLPLSQPRVSTLGTLKINEFALKLKGREADLISSHLLLPPATGRQTVPGCFPGVKTPRRAKRDAFTR